MAPKKRRLDDAELDAANRSLQSLLHRGSISQKGLATLLKDVKRLSEALPEHVNRNRLMDANNARFNSISHTAQMPLTAGGSWDWQFADPNKLISLMLRESKTLQDLFGHAIARHRPSQENPWTLIIGYDEFSPAGTMFDGANHKKAMNLSFTFAELGEYNIRIDDAWFTPIIVRHNMLAEIDGSWGAMLRDYLRLQLLSATGLTTAGVAVTIWGVDLLLFASLQYIVADLDGHRMGLDWNGAGSMRPCLRHRNVVKKDTGLAPAGGFVEITCCDPALFVKSDSSDIYQDADSLRDAHGLWAAGGMQSGRYKNLTKVLGLRFAPKGLLLCTELRDEIDVIDTTVIDWVHTELQDGVFTVDATLLLRACSAALDIDWEDLHAYFRRDWMFPAWSNVKSKALYKVFDRRRSPEEAKIKASASELLGLYALLRHFAEKYLLHAPGIDAEVSSFNAACDTMDVIMLTKHGRLSMQEGARRLRESHANHMKKHIAAYGTGFVIPKHHLMFDVADQWLSRKLVVDAFIIERLHLRVKQVLQPIDNTRQVLICFRARLSEGMWDPAVTPFKFKGVLRLSGLNCWVIRPMQFNKQETATRVFEKSCLASLLNVQLTSLQERRPFGDSLEEPVGQLPGTNVPMADKMLVCGMSIAVGDIVLLRSTAGMVRACAQEGDKFFALVEAYTLSSAVTAHSDRWQQGA